MVEVSKPWSPKSGFAVIGCMVVAIGWAMVDGLAVVDGCAWGAGALLLHAASSAAVIPAKTARRIRRTSVGFVGGGMLERTGRGSVNEVCQGERVAGLPSCRVAKGGLPVARLKAAGGGSYGSRW